MNTEEKTQLFLSELKALYERYNLALYVDGHNVIEVDEYFDKSNHFENYVLAKDLLTKLGAGKISTLSSNYYEPSRILRYFAQQKEIKNGVNS